MSDTPPVPPVPPVPPAPEPAAGVPPVAPPVAPPAPPVPPAAPAPTAATTPNPYAQPAASPYGAPAPYGAPGYAAPGAYGYAPKTNTLAIVALILAFFVPVGGVICGHIALRQISRTGEGGHGLALAGTILGYVFVALGILVGIIYAVVIVAAVSSGNYSSSSDFG